MNPVTHALTMNGRINGELKDRFEPPEVVIRKRLSLLDGSRRFALMLWALPPGVPLDHVDVAGGPAEYIQAAGSSERMTVEVRRIEVGGPRQYVIGRAVPPSGEQRESEVINWGERIETIIRPSEVFSADQAADLFVSYYGTGWIPESFTLRLLSLRPAGALSSGPLKAWLEESMASRLSSVAADLDDELEHRPATQLRKVATAAALLAIDRTHLVDPRLDEALAAVRKGAAGEPAECSAAAQVTEELDEVAWDIQEKVDRGMLPEQAYVDAFQSARAAASVSSALESNALDAAREAVYEAQAALEDLEAIRAAVSRALSN